jgi:8-oxo-dGTP pyrophosphatase MutT (NUDIX family)
MPPTRSSHRLTEQVKLLQKAVLVCNDSVLLLRRDQNAATRPLKWDLAGGNSEWPAKEREGTGLHAEDIAREIAEETGITIAKEQFRLDSLVYFETHFLDAMFTITVGWMVELPIDFDMSSIAISYEHSEYQWVPFDEVSQFDFDYGKDFIIPMIRTAQQKRHG